MYLDNINNYYGTLTKIKNLINCNNKFNVNVKIITADYESAIINNLKKIFPNVHLIGNLFHYKHLLRRQIAKLGLYKSVYKLETDEILKMWENTFYTK